VWTGKQSGGLEGQELDADAKNGKPGLALNTGGNQNRTMPTQVVSHNKPENTCFMGKKLSRAFGSAYNAKYFMRPRRVTHWQQTLWGGDVWRCGGIAAARCLLSAEK
jgi:hypothetical protein